MNQPQSYVFDVRLNDFQRFVIDNSFEVPVLVDFWADWCEPCRTLGPMLERLATEYAGAFLLAKINADSEQAIASHFNVRSLPTVMVVRDGQIVDMLAGVQPESEYRKRIDAYRPRAADAILDAAEQLWLSGRQDEALQTLRDGIAQEPAELDLKVALAAKLLETGEMLESGRLLRALPEAIQKTEPVPQLLAHLATLEAAAPKADFSAQEARLATDPNAHAVRLALANELQEVGEYEAAATHFLELMRRDRSFGDDAGRKGLIALFELLGPEHPLTGTYRRRMASLLY